MKRILVLLTLFAGSLFAKTDYNTITKEVAEGGNAGAGVVGGIIHLAVLGPVVLGAIITLGIIAFYFNKVEQKDRGWFKTVGATIGAFVLGGLLFIGTQKIGNVYSSTVEDCGEKLFSVYIQDATKMFLTAPTDNPYQFGTGIINHECLTK